MNSISCKASWTKLTNCARSFILALFGLCSLFSGSAANASITNDVAAILSVLNTRLDENLSAIGSDVSGNWGTSQSILQQVQYLRSDIGSDFSTINGNVTDIESILRSINSNLPGDNSTAINGIYNFLNSLRIIPGHPNSGEALYVMPLASYADNTSIGVAMQRLMSEQDNFNRGSSYLYEIQRALYGRSGVPSSSDSVVSLLQNLTRKNFASNVWTRSDIEDLISAIRTNSINVNLPPVLASNPYWVTNSSFAAIWPDWNNYVPAPQDNNGYSFPEAFSMLLSHRFSDSVDRDSLLASWGIGGQNAGHFYSFEDWLAEWLRSNMVLTTSSSISNLNEELAATDYQEQQNPTNVPLPQFRDLIADGDTSAAEDEISGAASVLTSKIEDLSGRIGTPNAEIVLFPAMTVGGITVRETRASLDSPITQTAHAVCVFIWYVALFASLFHLASAEFAFYANLGRNWVSSHGFIVDKESGDWV